MGSILSINNLNLFYNNFHALKNINLSIKKGEILGLIGESGSGKSSLANSILRLVPQPISKLKGKIIYNKQNLLSLDEKNLYQVRGKEISIIFQSHSSALNPVVKINKQVAEAINVHQKLKNNDALNKAEEILIKLDIPKNQLNYYPHQLSGGMKQRVMIATAIANNTKLLIADEPTTALDPNIEQGVVRLLYKLNKELGLSILFVSHDINLLATISDRLAIMYGGSLVEIGKSDIIFNKPMHPYSKLLINSIETNNINTIEQKKIRQKACPYANNCAEAIEKCFKIAPKEKKINGRIIKCHII